MQTKSIIDIPNTDEKSTKSQSVTDWYRCGQCGAIDKNVGCFFCHEVDAVEYFELLGMRYDDMNAVTLRI